MKANLEYVSRFSLKNKKLIYIGHSQGTTQLFAALTLNPDLQNYIECFIGLGPAIYIANINSGFV